jgi:hypothetical protein
MVLLSQVTEREGVVTVQIPSGLASGACERSVMANAHRATEGMSV